MLRVPARSAAFLSLGLGLAGAAADAAWLGPDGRPLPFERPDAVATFLENARPLESDPIETGSTRPLKLLLAHDDLRAHAVFRFADRQWRHALVEGRRIRDFRDSAFHECAAWRLSRLLSMESVPPCVERRLFGRRGTLQIWVEKAMTEKARRERGLEAPSRADWMRQRQEMVAFDLLIDNVDRNQGNLLIDESWRLWLIDHTRSFTRMAEIQDLSELYWVRRGFWDRLRALDRGELEGALGSWLEPGQIEALLARRDQLVAHVEQRIAAAGEAAVLLPEIWERGAEPAAGDLPPEGDEPPESTPILPDPAALGGSADRG